MELKSINYRKWAKKVAMVNCVVYAIVTVIYIMKFFLFTLNDCDSISMGTYICDNVCKLRHKADYAEWFYIDIMIQFAFIFVKIYFNFLLCTPFTEPGYRIVRMWIMVYASHLIYFYLSLIFEVMYFEENLYPDVTLGLKPFLFYFLLILHFVIIAIQEYIVYLYYVGKMATGI